VATTAEIRPSLGCDVAGSARNVTVPLYATDRVLSDRRHQLEPRP
jgi:hypothetical protein